MRKVQLYPLPNGDTTDSYQEAKEVVSVKLFEFRAYLAYEIQNVPPAEGVNLLAQHTDKLYQLSLPVKPKTYYELLDGSVSDSFVEVTRMAAENYRIAVAILAEDLKLQSAQEIGSKLTRMHEKVQNLADLKADIRLQEEEE